MTWIQRYRYRRFLKVSVWIVPFVSVLGAVGVHRLLWWVDARTRWRWLGFDSPGAQAAVGAIGSAMLTFTVFTFSILLLAIQIAGAQLTPRVVAIARRNRVLKVCLSAFLFTFTLSLCLLSRIGETVPQLPLVALVLSCFGSIGLFLYLVDYTARGMTPAGIIGRVAGVASEVIEQIYPHLLKDVQGSSLPSPVPTSSGPTRTIHYEGPSGVLQAVEGVGLAELARRGRCTIRVVPRVGDFVTKGEPFFHIYAGGEGHCGEDLHEFLVVGPERTPQQDPTFPFRMIVDIASKGLSPAINDPSTAVLALDQIHRLLRIVGRRHLGDGTVRDADGIVRVVLPTPDWEDFVSLGMTEIRLFGSGSIQVVRRLRAMIQNLLAVLPDERHSALQEQLRLLDRAVERSFPDPVDRAAAGISDPQGVGSSRDNLAPDGTPQPD